MKKILFASTALVATAGFAAADVSFSGAASMGLKYDDTAAEELTLHREVTLSIAMTGETDGGLTFGADLSISAGGIGDAVVYIEGGFGKLAAGDVDSADAAVTGLGDLGFDGIGTDDVAEAQRGSTDANLLYTGTFGDFTVAASYDLGTGTDNWAIGAKYTMGDYSFAAAYDDAKVFSAQLGANVGDFAVAALLSTSSADGESYGLTAGYTMGATTITAAYSKDDKNGEEAYGIGFGYDLGGGASVKGAIGQNGDGATVADLGITMSF